MPGTLEALLDKKLSSSSDPLERMLDAKTQPKGNPYIGTTQSYPMPESPSGPEEMVDTAMGPVPKSKVSSAPAYGYNASMPASEGQPLSQGYHQAAQTSHLPPAMWGIGEVPQPAAGDEARRAISQGFVNALPRGMPFLGDTIRSQQETNAQREPIEGVVDKTLGTMAGMAGGLANPENLPVMVAGGAVGKIAGEAAHPLVKWVSAAAGDRVGQALSGFISNSSQGAALAAGQAASDISPEEWMQDPMGSLGKVAMAATTGGALFGGIGAAHGAMTNGPVPEPSNGNMYGPRPNYPSDTQFKQDVQSAYGSRAPAPTEGSPVEPIGPVVPSGHEGPPETPYTPQRGFRGEQPQEVPSDQEVQVGVQGSEPQGQEPGRPVQEQVPSGEAPPAGGVLQAQGEVAPAEVPAVEPTPAEAKATLDVEKSARQHRDAIITQMPGTSVDDALAMDQQLHRDAIDKGRFASQKDALASDIEAKQQVRDLLAGKVEPTQEAIDQAKSTLARGRTTHVNNLGKRNTAQTGSKAWQQAWISAYDRALQAVGGLALPPPPLKTGDAATAKALLRPDNPDVKVGGKWLKKGHKLTKAGEKFLARQQAPAATQKAETLSPPPESRTSAPASPQPKPISFRYDPATKTTVVEQPTIEPPSPEKMREMMKKPVKSSAAPSPSATTPKQPAPSQSLPTPETGARTTTSASEKAPRQPQKQTVASSPSKQDTTPPPKQPPTEPAETVGPEGTSTRKASVDQDREILMNLPKLDDTEAQTMLGWLSEARKSGVPEKADAIAAAANATAGSKNPRMLTPVETAGIVVRMEQLKQAHAAASDPVELARIADDFDNLNRATRQVSGPAVARALVAHKLTIDESFDLLTVQQRVKTAKQADLTPEEKSKVAELVKKVEEAEAKVKEMQAKLPPDTPFPPPPMLALLGEADRMKYNVRSYINSKRHTGPLRRIADVLGVAKTAKTIWDLSAAGRQGFWLGVAHPIHAMASFGHQIKAMASSKAADTVMASIKNDPMYRLAQLAKLEITEYGGVSKDMLGREEVFQSKLGDYIPGAKASNRAYATYLNKLRFEVFKDMIDTLAKGGEPSMKEAKAIANYINLTTGRGVLHGDLATAANVLNTIFFSPRYLASRIELLVGQPLLGGSARTRGLILKEYAKSIGGLALVLGLGNMAGGTVELDPRSSDFLKLKFGDIRIDIMTGFSQLFTLFAREISGKTKGSTGDLSYPGDMDRLKVALNFMRSKLSPIPSTGVNVLQGQDVQGRQTSVGTEAENLLAPMAVDDIFRSVQSEGVPRGAALGIASLIGFSVQTHRHITEQQQGKIGYKQAMDHLDNVITEAKKSGMPPEQRIPWVLQRVQKDMGSTKWYGPVIEQLMRKKTSIASP